MRKIIVLILSLCFLFYGCGNNNLNSDSNSSGNFRTEVIYEPLIINPSAEYVNEMLKQVPTIIGTEIVFENDAKVNKEVNGKIKATIFFSCSLLDQDQFGSESIAESGTVRGGSIDIFETAELALLRDEYLSKFDSNSILKTGYHKPIGSIVIRTSYKLSEYYRNLLEEAIIGILTEGKLPYGVEELSELAPTPTPTPNAVSSTIGTETRPEKEGFHPKNNEVHNIMEYTIEIPRYWISERKISDGIQRYAETGAKVAMLQITVVHESDDSYPVTFEGLYDDNENMISAIESSSFEKVTSYEIIDTGTIKGILYTGIIKDVNSGLSGTGKWFMFPSEEHRNWCAIILAQTDNTEYLYDKDFMRMIYSIKTLQSIISEPEVTPTSAPTPTPTPTPTPDKNKSEYEKAYIREMSNYDLYYMFDADTKSVVYFGTNDTYIENGKYTGDFITGIKITWEHGEWTEIFTHKSGATATLTDGNGWNWEYKVCDVEKAQAILNGL